MTGLSTSSMTTGMGGLRTTLWRAAGFGFFALGLVGTVLPVLPTTIFWIAAAWCLAKTCPRLHGRIMSDARLGPVIRDFLEAGVIAPRSKAAALAGMAIGGCAMVLAGPPTGVMAAGAAVLALSAIYVATRPATR